MYFHVCKKKYPASPGQHILLFSVSFERYMNNAINKGLFIEFHACVFKLHFFKKSQDFFGDFGATSPLTSVEKCIFQNFAKL